MAIIVQVRSVQNAERAFVQKLSFEYAWDSLPSSLHLQDQCKGLLKLGCWLPTHLIRSRQSRNRVPEHQVPCDLKQSRSEYSELTCLLRQSVEHLAYEWHEMVCQMWLLLSHALTAIFSTKLAHESLSATLHFIIDSTMMSGSVITMVISIWSWWTSARISRAVWWPSGNVTSNSSSWMWYLSQDLQSKIS